MNRTFCLVLVAFGLSATGFVRAQTAQLVNSPLIAEGDARLQQYTLLSHQARAAIKANDIPKAVELLKQAISAMDLEDSRALLADLYIGQGKTEAAIDALRPLVYQLGSLKSNIGSEPETRMKFVLLLLDKQQWAEAVKVYADTMAKPVLWMISNFAPERQHIIPNIRFSADTPDYDGMRAQAHLILGTREPMFLNGSMARLPKDCIPTMLDHLRQSLKLKPRSLQAQFVTGMLLEQDKRFAEARKAYLAAWDDANTPEELNEIKAAMDELSKKEEWKRYYEAQVAAQAKAAGKSKPTDPK